MSKNLPVPLEATAPKLLLDMWTWNVPAGFPSPAADLTRKRIDLNDHLIRNKEATFIFKVKGDSMINAGIYQGDALVIDRSIEGKAYHMSAWFKVTLIYLGQSF